MRKKISKEKVKKLLYTRIFQDERWWVSFGEGSVTVGKRENGTWQNCEFAEGKAPIKKANGIDGNC